MTPEQEISAASEAQTTLDDPVLVRVVSEQRALLWNAWRYSPARDKKGREFIYHQIKALDVVLAALQTVVDTGKMARISLDIMQQGGTPS
jgi:hypothetical protein